MGQGQFKGVDISESTSAVRTKIQSRLEQWAKLDPAEFHTVEGMDALRKSIGDVVDSAPYGTPERRLANEVYFAVRKSVEAQAPGYGKVLKGYHEASKHLKDLEQGLSLGKSASERNGAAETPSRDEERRYKRLRQASGVRQGAGGCRCGKPGSQPCGAGVAVMGTQGACDPTSRVLGQSARARREE